MRVVTSLVVVCLVFVATGALVATSSPARAGCPAFVQTGSVIFVDTPSDQPNAPGLTLRHALTVAGPTTQVTFAPPMCGRTITLRTQLPELDNGDVRLTGCAAGLPVLID